DNDLRGTDHCPGYASAARYVASCFLGDNVDVRSLPGIKINVVMGRNAGWLTAASALARTQLDDGPHLVYVPENAFDPHEFVTSVDAVYKRLGRCIVAVSEGIHDAQGRLFAESKEVDSHGNVQLSGSGALGDKLAALLKSQLGEKLRVRADTFGYAQRSYFGAASPVDAAEAREVGRVAARVALAGDAPSGTISIVRESDAPYRVSFRRSELSLVARETRPMEAALLAGPHDVALPFLDYLRPLVGDLPRPARLSDLPVARR
ncbi:MAG: 6-phosphofructokinase, partial [Planctomycetota bacterium]